MIIDCDRCEVRNIACDDCVVNVLLGERSEPIEGDTVTALRVLGAAGLTPPLQLRLPPAAFG